MNIKNHKTTFGAGLIALAFSTMLSSTAQAQTCTAVPTCEELGYNKVESDCATTPLKCPFDKTKCHCLTASELENVGGNSTGSCKVPNLGDILFSDMSCGSNMVDGKRVIGIIFEPDKRLALALQTTIAYWSTEYFDVPSLTNYSSSTAALGDWSGKSNTLTVINYCSANSKSCPAFDYVKNYSTMGTQKGDWYLPATGELNVIYTNKTALNNSLTKAKGQILPDDYHWSSSEYNSNTSWYQIFSDGKVSSGYGKANHDYHIRPVLQF